MPLSILIRQIIPDYMYAQNASFLIGLTTYINLSYVIIYTTRETKHIHILNISIEFTEIC